MGSSTAGWGWGGLQGTYAGRSKSAVLVATADPKGASMLADLDLLLIAVFCAATISCQGNPETPSGS